MFDLSDDSWTARAKPLDNPEVVAFFQTQDRFLTGDPNNPAHFDDPAHNVTLSHASAEGYIRLSDFAAQQDRLIAHYREIATLAARHNKPFEHIRHYFWMGLAISSRTQGFSFPWYSHWDEFDRLLSWIETATQGEQFDDIDQGWDFAILRREGWFFGRAGDGEGTEYANIRLPADQLITATRQARQQGPAAIGALTAALGADVWSRYHYKADAVRFGTPDWQPLP
ncbi:MAG: hypothetical protein NWS68_05625 [Erythrobacter sp.]|nr:hypothetical protein [Erythrobacter sp.]